MPEFFKIHIMLFVFIVDKSFITIYVKILEKEIVSLQSIFLFSVDTENQVNPIMKIACYVLALK